MPTWLIVFLFALGAVALFVVGMSLTLMIKGHHIDSEISTNKNMQRLGIRCAVQESREDSGQTDCADAGCSGNCSACDIEQTTKKEERRSSFSYRYAPLCRALFGNASCRTGLPARRSAVSELPAAPSPEPFYITQYFDRQTNHGLRRSFSL